MFDGYKRFLRVTIADSARVRDTLGPGRPALGPGPEPRAIRVLDSKFRVHTSSFKLLAGSEPGEST
jgi:hypothetical protein